MTQNAVVTTSEKMIVTFLLDETGSMMAVKDDTIGGFNSYLDGLRELPGEVAFTFLKFDSNRVEKVCVGKPVAEVENLTPATYNPGAFTPLYDAAVKAIRATEQVAAKAPEAKVLVVLQTDGEENSSREFKKDDLAELVKEKTAAGWQFVFLGCGIDAYSEASSLGIGASNTMSYGSGNSAQAFAGMKGATRAYAASAGGAFGFTAQHKRDAGDKFDPTAGWADPAPAPGPAKRPDPSPSMIRRAAPAKSSLVDDIDLTAT